MPGKTIHILKQLNLYITAGLIIALPFVVDRRLMFPTQSAKYFLFGFSIILITSIFLIGCMLDNRKFILRISKLDMVLAIFFLLVATRVVLDMDRYGIPQRFMELTGLACLYLALRNMGDRSFRVLSSALLVSGTAQAIYGNLQLYGVFPSQHSMFNITGGFFNPGPYAGFLAVVFPIALVVYLNSAAVSRSKPQGWLGRLITNVNLPGSMVFKYLSFVALVSILLVLPATRSRAAWLAVIASSLFIFANRYNVVGFIHSKLDTALKRSVTIIASIALVAMVFMGLYVMKKGSADGRLLIWKVTSKMIQQKPVFGFGYDQFKANYLNFQADYFEQSDNKEEAVVADNTTRAFNEYLQLTSELGIAGMMLIIAVVWFCFFGRVKSNKKGQKTMVFALRMSLLAFGVFALFSYPTEILPIKVGVMVCLAGIAAHQQNIDIRIPGFFNSKQAIRPIAILGSIAGLGLVLSQIYPLRQQYENIGQWKRAFITYQIGAYEASLPEYGKVYDDLKYNGDYLVNYGKALAMAKNHDKAISILSRAERFLPNTIVYTALGDSYKALGQNYNAEQAYLQASQILPDRFYPKYLLAKLYDETKQETKAIEMANELLNKEIKIKSMAVEEIKAEVQTIVDKSKLKSS